MSRKKPADMLWGIPFFNHFLNIFYYAEFTGHYQPDTTPVFTYPDGITMIMIADGPYSCKIKGYGKG